MAALQANGWVIAVTPPDWRRWLLTDTPGSRWQARAGRAYLSWVAFARNPLAMIGLLIVLVLVAMAAFAPWLTNWNPLSGGDVLTERLLPPGGAHWLGTDQQARDIWSRIVFGSRTSLLIIFMVAITAAPLGVIIGASAGYVGGWLDTALMRITDAFLAFPKLVLALAFAAALGAGIENAILAIAITSWPPYARIARSETLTIRNTDYISAARMSGASGIRILLGHILPMCLPSLVVRVTLDMAGIILIAAGLGFLGLGVAPPQPEWGSMVSDGRNQILEQWWVCTYPGIAIFVVSLGFNLIGDALRDVLDPREQ
ncbi:MAG TPA: ABC transporter permease [Candidatus Cybelea sp.]|nr:ABC transporter permease [Candidatus Cybelea sp.]